MEVKAGWMRVLIEEEGYLKLPPFFCLPISLFFYSKITVLSQNQFLNLKTFFVKCLGKFSLQKYKRKKPPSDQEQNFASYNKHFAYI